jgi:rhodanese-related sulfurtransferase
MKISLRTMLLLAGVTLIVSNACALAHIDVTVEQARELIASTNDLTVVDVREPYEYCDAKGHISGALNYPWSSGVLQARYEELPTDGPLLVVCQSGGRSNAAASFLDSKGFSEVYDMLRGMSAWQWETAPCKYSGGSGTADDPHRIATAADLIALGESPEDYDKHFILTADIDLDPNLPGGKVFDRAVIAGDTNDTQSGFQGTAFTGVFDGFDHTISHLTITGEHHLGLFGELRSMAEVRSLGVVDVNITGLGNYVGGLAGYNGYWDSTGGLVTNCYTTGLVSGRYCVGGLVGSNSGYVMHCHSAVTVSGGESIGGLVGLNYNGGITTSHSTGKVSGIGSFYGGVGGLVGDNGGSIVMSYSTCTISGNEVVGGFVGENSGSITTSYSTGTVSGNEVVGGLVGRNSGSITMSYSTGTVSGEGSVGGLLGINNASIPFFYFIQGSITTSFWDTETSGQATSAGGTGLTTVEMQDVDTFLGEGWDFADETLNGTCDYWQLSPGDYPGLRHHTGDRPLMPEGLGTAEAPYLIQDANDLGTVWFEPLAHYRLEATVDLSEITWTMAVIPWFGGTFDGNGYVISNLQIQGGGHLGLFGQLGFGAKISDLGLEALDIHGTHDCIGGLIGSNYQGSVTTSYSTGSVSSTYNGWRYGGSVAGLVGDNLQGDVICCHSTASVSSTGQTVNVGGLVGSNWLGNIATSYSSGTVSGTSGVGGLVGENGGSITTSYSTGTVAGEVRVGGLVGRNFMANDMETWQGSIKTSYSTCAVSGNLGVGGLVGSGDFFRVNNSFWDIETSGLVNSDGGIGNTTTEMQIAVTFLEAGWDFVGETANGTEDIWWILEGQDYPRLWWEAAGQ